MTDGQWDVIWTQIRGGWPFAQLADSVVEGTWREALDDLQPEDVVDAVKVELRNSERLPSIAAIRKATNEAARDRRLAQDAAHLKLDAPMAEIPAEFRGGWETVAQTLAKRSGR
jgi:hypothetical protein